MGLLLTICNFHCLLAQMNLFAKDSLHRSANANLRAGCCEMKDLKPPSLSYLVAQNPK